MFKSQGRGLIRRVRNTREGEGGMPVVEGVEPKGFNKPEETGRGLKRKDQGTILMYLRF